MIPKIFHLTAKDKSDLPATFQKNIARIRVLYPDHEIRIYDDDDIKTLFRAEMPTYYRNTVVEMPKFIMAVDTVRYLWMRLYGGIYCDMDVYFRRHVAFTDGAIFIEREWTWPTDPTIITSVHNCLFASAPGHPVWDHILDRIALNVRELKEKKEKKRMSGRVGKSIDGLLVKTGLRQPQFQSVFNVTGPNAISKVITEQVLNGEYRDFQLLPGRMIFQAGLSKGTIEEAAFVHETAGSWK